MRLERPKAWRGQEGRNERPVYSKGAEDAKRRGGELASVRRSEVNLVVVTPAFAIAWSRLVSLLCADQGGGEIMDPTQVH